jgi:hypothetical protein
MLNCVVGYPLGGINVAEYAIMGSSEIKIPLE